MSSSPGDALRLDLDSQCSPLRTRTVSRKRLLEGELPQSSQRASCEADWAPPQGKDRLPTLMQQVLHLAPDVACLQEVDRLSEHLPSLTLTMGYTSYIGYRQKSHGLLIAHKLSVFDKVGERGIRLDDLPLDESEPLLTPPDSSTPALSASGTATPVAAETDRSAPSGQAPGLSAANGTSDPVAHLSDKEKEILARPQDATSSTGRAARTAAGLSRTTRNVALFVALAFKDDPTRGVLVATTHTFWHPLHVYERARQTALIVAQAAKFRAEVGGGRFADWPLFLAGGAHAFQPDTVEAGLPEFVSLLPTSLPPQT